MSVPTETRTQLYLSNRGGERETKSIPLNNYLWTFFCRGTKLYCVGYSLSVTLLINENTQSFGLTVALDSGQNIVSNRLWLWQVTTDSKLCLFELEPNVVGGVAEHRSIELRSSNVASVEPDVVENRPTKVFIIEESPRNLLSEVYNDPFGGLTEVEEFEWADNRSNDLSSNRLNSLEYEIVYSATASPPNVYLEEYSKNAPRAYVEFTDVPEMLRVFWDTVEAVDGYQLQRDVTPNFNSSQVAVVYEGPNNLYIDTVPYPDVTYYYRARGFVN